MKTFCDYWKSILFFNLMFCIFTFFVGAVDAKAACTPVITEPACGGTIQSGSDISFNWNTCAEDSTYWLSVATDPVKFKSSPFGDIFSQDLGFVSGHTVSIPASIPDGSTIYVRLWYEREVWKYIQCSYQIGSGGGGVIPGMISPAPGSTLSGATETFSWSANGANVSKWWLYIGSSSGGNDIYDSGLLGKSTSDTVSGLPTDGSMVYVRLFYKIGTDKYREIDYTYTACTGNTGGGVIPGMTSPAPGSTLSGATETFSWSANGANVSKWWLYIGSSSGGNDIYDSGLLGKSTSDTVKGLPTDGSMVYVRLFYKIGTDKYREIDYTYTAHTGNTGGGVIPGMTSPAPGSTLSGATETFTWSRNGADVSAWWLHIGSSAGGKDIYDSRALGTSTSDTVSGLPADGSTVYVRLFYQIGTDDWREIDYTYTAYTDNTDGGCGTLPPSGIIQVGTIQVSNDVAFQAVASSNTLYFVYNQDDKLYLSKSADGGTTWSSPQLASHLNTNKKFSLAVDSTGKLHLVYSTSNGSASWYRSNSSGKWNSPVLMNDTPDFQDTAPVVAVDGNDNVHVILWSYPTDWQNTNWKAESRIVYRLKIAGQEDFDAPEFWKAGFGSLGAGNGTIEISSQGDVHFLYVGLASSNSNNAVERRILHKNGTWDSRHDIFPKIYIGDYAISGAVGSDEVLHMAIFEAAPTPKGVGYFKSTQPNVLKKVWQKYEYWEANTDILVAPNGDVWMTSANHPFGTMHDPEEYLASYWHYDKSSRTWSSRMHVSEADYTNVDHTHFGQPKLLLYNGNVLMFYAEKAPGSNFKFYQRNFN
ncbi:MAG: exo-alpha-sialidase [Candidatus Scalindua sp.]|nr:exo-alpha-sialidase [Candidatus Scalindua sp.]